MSRFHHRSTCILPIGVSCIKFVNTVAYMAFVMDHEVEGSLCG